MQYKKLGLKWFFKVGALHQLLLTMDKNVARNAATFHIGNSLAHINEKIQSNMKLLIYIMIFVVFVSLNSCQSQEKLEYPDFYVEKLEAMPDVLMTDKRMSLPDGGGYFCGPVSVVNSLIYLHNIGYENLLPDFNEDTMNVFSDVIEHLSGDDYMKTMTNKITPQGYMIRGLKRYIKEVGYESEKIEYRDFGKKPTNDINWLKS